ncbi:hypothetical protein D3C83_183630 [compost metagenome]
MPPSAHSEPASIVSHRSLSSAMLAAASAVSPVARAAMTRSITSTPRVEPMRHGVHLPHDSIAQNSMA